MAYEAASERYSDMQYRFCGKSGLKLPALSLGLWHNFGDTTPISTQRDILRTAFDLGITHFDLANNYGPPYGSAETNFGRIFKDDFRPYRDELLISSKAGWDMWPGPYGQGGGSRKYILASLDQSLQRMGLDYVDIFYSHRFDVDTPLDEIIAQVKRTAHGRKHAKRKHVNLEQPKCLDIVLATENCTPMDRGNRVVSKSVGGKALCPWRFG